MTTATPRKPAKRIGGAPFSLPRRWPSAEPAFASARERDRKAASASASPRKPALHPQLVAATPRGAQTARSARGDDARSVASVPYTARAEEYVSRLVGRTDGNASNDGALEWPLVVELDVADYLNQESERRKRVQQQRLDNRAHLLEQQARQQRERDAGRSLRRQWREDLEADAELYRQEEKVKRAQNLEIRRRFDDERRIQLEHMQRQRRSQREADEREGREMVAAAQEAKRAEEEREEQRRLKERAVALKLAAEAEAARERKARLLREEHQNDVRMAQAQQELLDQQERERSRAIEAGGAWPPAAAPAPGMGGVPASAWFDPLALCQETTEFEEGRSRPRRDGSRGRRRDLEQGWDFFAPPVDVPSSSLPPPASTTVAEQELQSAILRSLQDQGENDEPELQQALHLSCVEATGDAQPPEEVSEAVQQLHDLLATLGLQRLDVGSTNMSEGGAILSNQCFYLAIARSWLADAASAGGMLVRDSALQLKREIEARVLQVRGSSAEGDVGEEREAYVDYLECAMRKDDSECSGGTVADLAIAVFASCSGGLEAYEGGGYAQLPREQRVANLSLIWHRAGHFEAVVAAGSGGKADLTLEELLKTAAQKDIATACVKV